MQTKVERKVESRRSLRSEDRRLRLIVASGKKEQNLWTVSYGLSTVAYGWLMLAKEMTELMDRNLRSIDRRLRWLQREKNVTAHFKGELDGFSLSHHWRSAEQFQGRILAGAKDWELF